MIAENNHKPPIQIKARFGHLRPVVGTVQETATAEAAGMNTDMKAGIRRTR